jgi:hypothetical protein
MGVGLGRFRGSAFPHVGGLGQVLLQSQKLHALEGNVQAWSLTGAKPMIMSLTGWVMCNPGQ